jgi:hypothetical protein
MSAEAIQPYEWFATVVALCCPMIEQLQAELAAADWCHPGGREWIHSWLEEARGEATAGRPDAVHRLLDSAPRKLDTEWFWYSRGGSDFPPERPVGEHRPACEWLALETETDRLDLEKKGTGGRNRRGRSVHH